MIVDGKALAAEVEATLINRLKVLASKPHLVIILVGDDSMSVKYTNLKKKFGDNLGFQVTLKQFDQNISTEELVLAVKNLAQDSVVDGLIIQLPLPANIDRDSVVAAINPAKDVDALSLQSAVSSPVVEAIKYILAKYNLSDLSKFKAVVVGHGYLVGQPVAKWLSGQVADLKILTVETNNTDSRQALLDADLIIAGAGVPHLIKPADIKDGVILIDASTSDVGGQTMGDIHPDCAAKAKLFTPVPGGVGPLTVRMLFANLLQLVENSTIIKG